ncbi:rhamnulokinase family protein [Humibacter sp. RRB41]|uniref:rhamnulokinase n=1 Tax=Humibacter sp. RRB41 TaxID=2919946 RepID=UPI001FA9AACC|nr:rhamnulokinase family protein [Humibacter sp. RRB41]
MSGTPTSASRRAEVTVAAVDLGATSGRVIAGTVSSDGIRLDEVSRFRTGAERRVDGWHWDFARIFGDVQAGLGAAHRAAGELASVGVDSWAVDYGLMAGGELLREPFHYRDERSERGVRWVGEHITDRELFERNGLQYLPFNSLYQLETDRLDGVLDDASRILLIPDLVVALLTGREVAERTNASTTGLLDARTHEWDNHLLELLGLDRTLFPALVDPGTVVGQIATLGETPMVTVGSHDTASAVVGVPATTDDFAYISCGTWGLVGLELERPILTEDARTAGFTNELGVDGRVRFLHNVMGLWLLDESVRQWREDGTTTLALADLLGAAAEVAHAVPLFDADDPVFMAPGDMPARIAAWFDERGRCGPSGIAETVRSIIESLAQTFADTVEKAAALSGRDAPAIHIVGGGSRNELLCRSVAARSGRTVLAGPSEATALGNVLVQARAIGAGSSSFLGSDLESLRGFAATAFPPRVVRPAGGRIK